MTALFQSLGVSDVWQLVAATMIFLMLPGPGTFCLLTCSAQRGLRGGFASLAGLMLADGVLMFLAAAGVAALLQAHPAWFSALQYLGAIYLAYLGLLLLGAGKKEGSGVVPFSHLRDFRRGLFVTLINPKAIVFYMAFFPLFLHPQTHSVGLGFVTMGLVISLCTLFYGSFLVVAGNAAARRFAGDGRIASLARRLAGLFLVAFGIRLTTN